jgi:predicted TPR repeat methyltransferase
LDAVFAGARGALRARGWFVFTVERATDELAPMGYRLSPLGRYCHAHDYVLDALTKTGFRITSTETAMLRNEGGVPVAGLVVTSQACEQTASD